MEQEPLFRGYSQPTSSTTYTPNQFFDVVLRHGSRGVVRLVAFMIRKTLGWSDENGQPQEPEVHFSYRQLEQQAGIGHSMIRSAIEDAVAARYIRCIQPGVVNKPGVLGNAALYELSWDERDEYITAPDDFTGFFAGNGNLTYIPNDFFDFTIPTEPLALIRVVGAIIRYTIGFQTHFGFRRQKIAMSVTEIQKKTGIKGRQHIVQALQEGMERNHIVRLEMGFFDPEAGKESRPAVYGIKWVDTTSTIESRRESSDTPKRLPEERPRQTSNTPKRLPENSTQDTPKRLPGRTEKVTGEYSEKVTGTEITGNNTSLNNNNRSSAVPNASPVAVAEISISPSAIPNPITDLLKEVGFDALTARKIAAKNPEAVIRQQISWLPLRNPSRNPLGMLRRAIEENWPAPVVAPAEVSSASSDTKDTGSPARNFSANFYAGWAGNPGRSAAPPSANDLAAAAPFVQMLLELCPDPAQAGEWGREFGAYARKREQDNPKVIRSLVYALRTHGDAFYLAWREKRKHEIGKARSAALKAHEERYQEPYREYLRAREEEIRLDTPEAYSQFLDDEAEKRARYSTGIFTNSKLALRILETHDRDEERLQRFREFFQQASLPTVLDFWEWDRGMNPDRFDAGENV
jgi:hypothetical protein